MIALIGIIFFLIALYLLSGKATWFSRFEIKKSIQPGDDETGSTSLELFDYYIDYTDGNLNYIPKYSKEENAEYMVVFSDQFGNKPLKTFEVEYGFFNQHSLKNLAKTFKFIGYMEWLSQPSKIVNVTRSLVYGILLPIIKAVFIGLLLFTALVAFSDAGLAFFVEFNAFFIMIAVPFHTVHIIKEFIAYIIQNRYSLKLAKAFGVSDHEYAVISRYLWKSFILYVLFQSIKIVMIVALMFAIVLLYN